MKFILLALLLTGCVWQKVDVTDVMKSEQACKNLGGFKTIRAVFDGVEKVECTSGDIINLENITLDLFEGSEE